MTHSALRVDLQAMRIAAVALACCLSAIAVPAAVVGAEPALNLPPFPGGAPAAPGPATQKPPTLDAHAYAPPRARTEAPRPSRGRTCFGQSETREKIAQRRLWDPVGVMRAGRSEGEVLRTRLCRWKADELVYEVYVLRRDGHLVRLYIDAQNGQGVSPPDLAAEHK